MYHPVQSAIRINKHLHPVQSAIIIHNRIKPFTLKQAREQVKELMKDSSLTVSIVSEKREYYIQANDKDTDSLILGGVNGYAFYVCIYSMPDSIHTYNVSFVNLDKNEKK